MTRLKMALATLWKRAQIPGRWAKHPDDRKDFFDGLALGAKLGPLFVKDHAVEIERLITTYADDDAKEQFEMLREAFWGGGWKPKRAQAAERQRPDGEPK